MSFKLVVFKRDEQWGLYRREWDGIDKPDYIHLRWIDVHEAIELVQTGTASDLWGGVGEILKNPLDEIAGS
jgi:hypothetical protein